jgi:Uma2 family endonuclease
MGSDAVRYTPHYSAAEYRQWEGDWELWDGIPVCMSPSPTAKHQMVGLNIASILKDAVGQTNQCDCIVIHETDWQISDATVVRPDIAVLCHGLPDQFIDYPPSLIVEILSPSTAAKDRTAKRQLYASEGVSIYLIVDPDTKSVEAMQLADSEYQLLDCDGEVLSVDWNDHCRAFIRFADVFSE